MQNLFLAAGHFRSGLHLSCATAVAMANEMEGIPNTIDLQPFRVGRG
jgi:glycine oxidase